MTRKKNEIEQVTPVSKDGVLPDGEIPVAAEGERPAVTESFDTSGGHDGSAISADSDDKPLLLTDAEGAALLENSSEEIEAESNLQERDDATPHADADPAEDSEVEKQAGEDSTKETEGTNPTPEEDDADHTDAVLSEESEADAQAVTAEQGGEGPQGEDDPHLPTTETTNPPGDNGGSGTDSDRKAQEDEGPKPRRRTSRKKKADEVPEDAGDSNDPPAAVKAPTPARKKRAAPKVAEAPVPAVQRPSAGVLTIENRAEVETPEDKEELVWHEMQNALRTRRILSGTLGGIESTENHNIIAVIYYKDLRVVIPVSEMMIQLSTEPNNYGEMAERQNKILNNMLGCEVDFVVRGIDARTRSVVASRREAMLRKRKTFYLQPDLNGQCQIHEGRVVQARVIAVATKVVRVEVFGVETSILARDLSWEWIGDAHERYMVGDEILIRLRKVTVESPEKISIEADVRSVTENTVQANLKKCKVQGKYAGTVTDIHKGVVFVRLAIGVNAIAHACYDNRMPAKSDDVSFAVTHIDEDRGVAVGIITRIIKQRI